VIAGLVAQYRGNRPNMVIVIKRLLNRQNCTQFHSRMMALCYIAG